MNDEKDDCLDTPESISNDSAAPAGDDSFSAGEIDDNDQKLTRQIKIAPDGLPATRNPAYPTSAGDSDDDPPGWPDF